MSAISRSRSRGGEHDSIVGATGLFRGLHRSALPSAALLVMDGWISGADSWSLPVSPGAPWSELFGAVDAGRGKLRYRNQTCQSLKEQHSCTADTQGTQRGDKQKAIAEKVWEKKKIAKNCEKLRTSFPPPHSPAGC